MGPSALESPAVAVVGAGSIGVVWSIVFARSGSRMHIAWRRRQTPPWRSRSALHVQECAPESVEIERDLFARLDREAAREAVLASSSSTITASQFAGELPGRERCLVAHPANPQHPGRDRSPREPDGSSVRADGGRARSARPVDARARCEGVEERRELLPIEDWETRVAWRDRMLMAFERARRLTESTGMEDE
jgi:hypothetical protein